jgi:GTP-binding protein HflX
LREKSFFTKGKLHELSALVQQSKRQGTQAVMINTTKISARQQHVLETSWQLPVYDRFAVILAIFESRATTKQAQLQVELAKLDYAKARVVLGTSGGFDRQKGGIGALGGSGGKVHVA